MKQLTFFILLPLTFGYFMFLSMVWHTELKTNDGDEIQFVQSGFDPSDDSKFIELVQPKLSLSVDRLDLAHNVSRVKSEGMAGDGTETSEFGESLSLHNELDAAYKPENDLEVPSNDVIWSITSNEAIESSLDNFTLKPLPFLPNYKNPCWYETVDITNAYTYNMYAYGKHRTIFADYFNHTRMTLKDRLHTSGSGNKTWILRCLPRFYLVGVSRCGTTDLMAGINRHPHILVGLIKEFSYWNRIRIKHTGMEYNPSSSSPSTVIYKLSRYPRSFQNYLEVFDKQAETIRNVWIEKDGGNYHYHVFGDFTPSYLWDFDGWRNLNVNKGLSEPARTVADYIKLTTPHAKVIIILRNPADRLYSDFNKFRVVEKRTSSLFHTLAMKGISAFKACLKRANVRACVYDYRNDISSKPLRVRAGLYYPYIAEWMDKFPGQILVARFESYSKGRAAVLKKIYKFLEIPPLDDDRYRNIERLPIKNSGEENVHTKILPMLSETRRILEEFYKPWNKKLAALLKDNGFLWNR